MNLAFKRFKVYLKLTLMAAVALLVVVLVWCNRNNTVSVWFFREFKDINVLWLIASTASTSIIAWRLVSFTVSVFGDMRELRRQDQMRDERKQQKELARRLEEHDKALGKRQPEPEDEAKEEEI